MIERKTLSFNPSRRRQASTEAGDSPKVLRFSMDIRVVPGSLRVGVVGIAVKRVLRELRRLCQRMIVFR
jgi:hypothetical protein